jgi:hypothetical protein
MSWLLRRIYLPKGTLGILSADGLDVVFWILEDLPGNGPNHCVPEGTYVLEHHVGTRYKDHWALVNHALGVYHQDDVRVTGERIACLIHNGSFVTDTEGCLLIGFHVKPNEPMVYNSRIALDAFHTIMRNNPQLRELRIQRG